MLMADLCGDPLDVDTVTLPFARLQTVAPLPLE